MSTQEKVQTLDALAELVDYSLVEKLNPDLDATEDGLDYSPREVFSGHYVPVKPTPIAEPIYIAHSKKFFEELGLSDDLATSEEFMRLFSGDTSALPEPLKKLGWATGYALSIYGTEYYQQCPFQTGNAYGDGRAISVLELLAKGKRWEMQLKGGGRTPYCRGADGRAVLRSSVREFLAQEHMDALGIKTSRSLTLYTSKSETVRRPWFLDGSYSKDPELMIEEPVAITTRVAPSFLRVGQIELFARRARKNEHPRAMEELKQIVEHLIEREYSDAVNANKAFNEQILILAETFSDRLTSLVAEWIRVGYTQGNFNGDNCAAGGFTLDYGPFGFMDNFDPKYQPWTGGGAHFSFLNQPQAAEKNFAMFCKSLRPLLQTDTQKLATLQRVEDDFAKIMHAKMIKMWSAKLGLSTFNPTLFNKLIKLMMETSVDYTLFFRELSHIPNDISALSKSFYNKVENLQEWTEWLEQWRSLLNVTTEEFREQLSTKMKQINPKYTLREWFLVPAYKAAQTGDYTLVKELQDVMNNPYSEQDKEIQEKYYRKKPAEYFAIAGISYVSCSS